LNYPFETYESSDEVNFLKLGLSYQNKPYDKYKINFDLIKYTTFPFYFPLLFKIMNINSNSSVFESYNIELIKFGFGLGGNFLSNKKGSYTTIFPKVERFSQDNRRNYLLIFARFDFGYTYFKLDDKLISLDNYNFLLEKSIFDVEFSSGLYYLVLKNILLSIDYNIKFYDKDDYLYSFRKIKVGAEILLYKPNEKSYLTGSINAIQNQLELTNNTKKEVIFREIKHGISLGLSYHL
jgi:hypothetical protein